jgi:hypothetical protein
MYGCHVVVPNDEGADLGVVFFRNAGYSTACGHGTIALVTWALDSGVVSKSEGEQRVVVDVPSGRLETCARLENGRVRWSPDCFLSDNAAPTESSVRHERARARPGQRDSVRPEEAPTDDYRAHHQLSRDQDPDRRGRTEARGGERDRSDDQHTDHGFAREPDRLARRFWVTAEAL